MTKRFVFIGTNNPNIQRLRNGLHAIHQNGSLRQNLVVQSRERRDRLRLYRVVHLRLIVSLSAYPIDLRLDPSFGDESRQLAIDERRRHAEAIRHRLQRAAIPHASPRFRTI